MRHLHKKIAHSYANAFLDWIAERGYTLDAEIALMTLVTSLKEGILDTFSETTWFEVCHAPSLTQEAKAEILSGLAEKINHEDLQRFLTMVLDNHRLGYLPAILEALLVVWAKRRGRVEVDLQVAAPMEASLQEAIHTLLKQRFGFTHVTFNTTLDPQLLAGFVLRVGDKMIDTSWRTKLQQIEVSLLQA
jgi:F-type H+-transporting ATPase subunit delta